MAGFCTKCGATLNESTAFCTKCGAPAAVTAAGPGPTAPYTPPTSNAPAAYTPPPSAYTPMAPAPAQKSGSSALRIVLIIVAIFVGLGILGVAGFGYFAYRVSRAVRVADNGKGVEISTPGGTFSAGDTTVTASDLGVDLYPGASQEKGAVRINTPKGSAITAVYDTGDSMDKVIDFYKAKLGSGASFYQSEKSAVLSLNNQDNKESLMVTVSNDSPDGKTRIVILHEKSS